MYEGPLEALKQASPWDVLVVGGGPAGSMTAWAATRAGLSVLLCEKSSLPRSKVCGSFFNARAKWILDEQGLGDLASSPEATPVRTLDVRARGRSALLELPAGFVMERAAFDQELLERAGAAGATVVAGTTVRVVEDQGADRREARLRRGEELGWVTARVVVDATGLAGLPGVQGGAGETLVQPTSRIGAGTILPAAHTGPELPAGSILMSCAASGYVGMTRLADDRLCVACALAPEAAREAGNLGRAARAILATSGSASVPELAEAVWTGTPLLTRRPAEVAAWRLIKVGDAAGFVEPFSGEGLAWALAAGVRAASFLQQTADGSSRASGMSWTRETAHAWTRAWRQAVGRRQTMSRLLSRLLRHPRATSSVVGALGSMPRASRFVLAPVLRTMNAPPAVERRESRRS